MLGYHSTPSEAVEQAIRMAALGAKYDGRKVVILEKYDAARQVIWDSEKDGFSSG